MWRNQPSRPPDSQDWNSNQYSKLIRLANNPFLLTDDQQGTTLQCYIISSNTWQQMASLPNERYRSASAVVGDNLVLIGGQINQPGNQKALSSALQYSFTSNTWKEFPSFPQEVVLAAACAHKGTVYVCGGKAHTFAAKPGENLYYSQMNACNTTTGKWVQLAPMSGARSQHVMFNMGSHIYVTGGTLPGWQRHTKNAEIQCYDIDSNQ